MHVEWTGFVSISYAGMGLGPFYIMHLVKIYFVICGSKSGQPKNKVLRKSNVYAK